MIKKKIKSFVKSKTWLGIILPVALIVLWQLAANIGLINASLLPSPERIWKALVKQAASGKLTVNILVSLRRVLIGYVLGASLGIVIGIITGLSKTATKIVSVLFELIRPIPIIAWVPVLILWTGIGETSKIIVIMIGTFWTVYLNTSDGIRNVDRKYVEVSKIFLKSKRTEITKVMFPAALPGIFTGLRVGVGSAWISVIGAELIAASAGLGFMISYYREMAQPSTMFAGVFMVGIIGFLINVVLRRVEKSVLKWNTVK